MPGGVVMRGRKPDGLTAGELDEAREPPEWLSPLAAEEWRRAFPWLVRRRTLSESDLGSLENYCDAQGTVREMARVLQEEGHIVATDKGPRKHPAVSIQSDAMTRARLLASELGLTPVSRSRPAVTSPKVMDDDAEDLFGL